MNFVQNFDIPKTDPELLKDHSELTTQQAKITTFIVVLMLCSIFIAHIMGQI